MVRLAVVAGTRPELTKLAPVFWELERRGLEYVFIWSGQHYDYMLSGVFMEELRLPEPDASLGVGSGSHAAQTARLLVALEDVIDRMGPGAVAALGDTNTVLAAVKKGVPFIHIEAGLRSWNMTMPEEVNRIAADHVAQLLLAPTRLAALNLAGEGIPADMVRVTGNTVVDALASLSVGPSSDGGYVLATIHRQENTDNPSRLASIVRALGRIAAETRVVMPLHPRTRKRLGQAGLLEHLASSGVELLGPLSYHDFVKLLASATVVVTDSGGVQEEALTLHVPTVTVRYNTEQPETVMLGCNVLAGADEEEIVRLTRVMAEKSEEIRRALSRIPNPYGEGDAAAKIVDAVEGADISIREPDMRGTPMLTYALEASPGPGSRIIYGVSCDGSITRRVEGTPMFMVRRAATWPKRSLCRRQSSTIDTGSGCTASYHTSPGGSTSQC